MLSKEHALANLRRQADLVESLKAKPSGSADFKKWHRDTEIAIEKSFGSDTRHLRDFNGITYSLGLFTDSTRDYEFQNAYGRGLR